MRPPRTRTKALVFAVLLGASGCAVRTTYGPTTYDANRCQWVWVTDGFGGYQQLSCWHTPYATYQPYVVDGAYVRVYPQWYVGPRPRVAPAPSTVVVPPRPPMPQGPPPRPPYGVRVR